MSVQPVEISKAYRLLQVGSTTMISAKYDGVENVMSAAWVGLADGLRIVQKGLNPGDSVIVDGLQKVFMPGMPVNAKTVAMTSSATLN